MYKKINTCGTQDPIAVLLRMLKKRSKLTFPAGKMNTQKTFVAKEKTNKEM